MTIEELRKAKRAEPFTPFTIHRHDGQMHEVLDRDHIMAPEDARTIALVDPGGGFALVDLDWISHLEFGGSGPSAKAKQAG